MLRSTRDYSWRAGEFTAWAERALALVPDVPGLLYTRVDAVDGDDGRPRVMGLELVGPNLFPWLHEGSLPRVDRICLSG